MTAYSLEEIAEKIDARVVYLSDDSVRKQPPSRISSIATLAKAEQGQIAFLANKKYREQLKDTQASAVIISADCLDDCQSHALVMDNPYVGYALVAQLLNSTPAPAVGIHVTAVIADDVVVGENVSIGANCVIETGVNLADNVTIGAGCFIGQNVIIGENTSLWSNVSIYHRVEMGKNCLVQANTVIGSDGFGYANDKGQWLKIPQLGAVIIGDNVEIGANTTIDRGALDNTLIHNGVILDNQIQIAHNVEIGENTAIAACTVVAGSTKIGKNCVIAGLVAINGHITIADGCHFTGTTMVTKSIRNAGVYSSGMPATTNKEWHKTNARVRKLDVMTKNLKALAMEVASLKNTLS